MYVSVSAFVFFVIMSSYTAQLTGALSCAEPTGQPS